VSHEPAAQRAPYIAVVGPSEADADTYALADEVGRLIAGRGGVVVCGGHGGVMEAAARGAAQAGGTSVGILPGSDRATANPYVTVAVATGLGQLRNGLVVRTSDAVVAIGGSWGTLSEVALAVRSGVPVISLHGWAVVDADGLAVDGVTVSDSAADAVQAALTAAGADA
jgi:uncharacterized protein (TIGR00725 family)